MSLTDLFIKLGAPLANQRWSWGAIRYDGSVVLRVWQDRKRKIGDNWYMMVTHHEKYIDDQDNLGHQERIRHVEKIRKGAKCYMVMCLAKDPSESPRSIKSFNQRDVFIGGAIEEVDGDWWIELAERIPI